MQYNHTPVMLQEVLEYLKIESGKNYLDGTLGGGGYTRAIAKLANPGKVMSTDADLMAIEHNKVILNKDKIKNVILVNGNFQDLSKFVKSEEAQSLTFNGLVLDLGLSGAQLEDEHRGFSFKLLASPLDMAFGPSAAESTSAIVNTWTKEELTRIFKTYGEEPFARPIAERIVTSRIDKKIETIGELVAIIEKVLPNRLLHKKGIHWATRVFQALRIATNAELEVLETTLAESLDYLAPGSRIVIVSYHSLEDRIVKHFFRDQAKTCVCPPAAPWCNCNHKPRLKIITKRVLLPTETEVQQNPRSRSAKLRVAEVI